MLTFAPLHPLRQGLERASMAIVRQGRVLKATTDDTRLAPINQLFFWLTIAVENCLIYLV
jgi:hypothetical protein